MGKRRRLGPPPFRIHDTTRSHDRTVRTFYKEHNCGSKEGLERLRAMLGEGLEEDNRKSVRSAPAESPPPLRFREATSSPLFVKESAPVESPIPLAFESASVYGSKFKRMITLEAVAAYRAQLGESRASCLRASWSGVVVSEDPGSGETGDVIIEIEVDGGDWRRRGRMGSERGGDEGDKSSRDFDHQTIVVLPGPKRDVVCVVLGSRTKVSGGGEDEELAQGNSFSAAGQQGGRGKGGKDRVVITLYTRLPHEALPAPHEPLPKSDGENHKNDLQSDRRRDSEEDRHHNSDAGEDMGDPLAPDSSHGHTTPGRDAEPEQVREPVVVVVDLRQVLRCWMAGEKPPRCVADGSPPAVPTAGLVLEAVPGSSVLSYVRAYRSAVAVARGEVAGGFLRSLRVVGAVDKAPQCSSRLGKDSTYLDAIQFINRLDVPRLGLENVAGHLQKAAKRFEAEAAKEARQAAAIGRTLSSQEFQEGEKTRQEALAREEQVVGLRTAEHATRKKELERVAKEMRPYLPKVTPNGGKKVDLFLLVPGKGKVAFPLALPSSSALSPFISHSVLYQ